MAEKSEMEIPIAKVMAKPRTIPEPNQYKIAQVIREEILESRIEGKALANPNLSEVAKSLPSLNSSFILSKIRILASTAMPIERINPAIPAKVKVTGIILKIDMTIKA